MHTCVFNIINTAILMSNLENRDEEGWTLGIAWRVQG